MDEPRRPTPIEPMEPPRGGPGCGWGLIMIIAIDVALWGLVYMAWRNL